MGAKTGIEWTDHTFNPWIGCTKVSPGCGPGYRLLNWVIVGGESGKGARPCDVQWIRDLIQQCQAAGVPVFVKQLGAVPVTGNANLLEWPEGVRLYQGKASDDGFAFAYIGLNDRKGGTMSEWPEDCASAKCRPRSPL